MNYREIAKAIRDPENQPHQFSDADLAQFFVEAADEIERLRRIIYNLLDDGDETDRAAARAALKGDD